MNNLPRASATREEGGKTKNDDTNAKAEKIFISSAPRKQGKQDRGTQTDSGANQHPPSPLLLAGWVDRSIPGDQYEIVVNIQK